MDQSGEDKWLLSQVLRAEHHAIRTLMDAQGMFRGDVPIYMHLSGGKQMSQRELARATELAPATINATVKRLTEQGYILRLPDKDGRVVRLMLSPEGEGRANVARAVFSRVHLQMLDGFTVEERVLLRRFLLQMRENIAKLEKQAEIRPETVLVRTKKGDVE